MHQLNMGFTNGTVAAAVVVVGVVVVVDVVVVGVVVEVVEVVVVVVVVVGSNTSCQRSSSVFDHSLYCTSSPTLKVNPFQRCALKDHNGSERTDYMVILRYLIVMVLCIVTTLCTV